MTRSLLKNLAGFWNQALFVQKSPAPLAVFRICFGLIVLSCYAFVFPNLLELYGPQGIPSHAAELKILNFYPPSLFYHLPPTESVTYCLWGLLMLSALLVTVGLFTRPANILLYVMILSFCQRNLVAQSALDDLMSGLAFLLMFSDCGTVFSVDSFRAGRRTLEAQWQYVSMPWAQFLMQCQIGLFYFQSVTTKLTGTTWLDGTAVYYALCLKEYKRFDLPFLYQFLWQVKLLTWGTLFIEILLFTAIWSKRFRYYVMALGLILHLGIEVTMHIPFFETLTVVTYLLFVDPDDLKKVINRLTRRF